MKKILLLGILFMFLFSCSTSNLFPRKYLGTYHGVQEAYEVSMNGSPITVPAAEYELLLDNGKLWITSPKQKIEASYEVKLETEMYYNLVVQLETGVVEEWQLWKKGAKLIRKSIAPKPDVIFLAD
ncbi:hypothetical protein ERX46_12505 [Brumimicrobium glaciale]|uniref:Uncharacterized protein n=1 Tax=Brumimicrobium glaciale TaxID=200475 RepID=A0A4Q4KI35_9FLAO|nr:hypothetical protein [Brumimicrobium glaciale]RYM32872.1 hypothetical protein ERX46_12505 [Brumimicrobium glaciale]